MNTRPVVTFVRDRGGDAAFTDSDFKYVARTLEDRGPDARVPWQLKHAATSRLMELARERMGTLRISYFDAVKSVMRDRPELGFLNRVETLPSSARDLDLDLVEGQQT